VTAAVHPRIFKESQMAMPAFRTPTSLHPEGFGQLATMPSRKERLAIVSTDSKLCGIAAYTAALRRQLGDAFDITVFNLDQYLLRSPHRRVRKLADRHIQEICRAIQRFDVVNLQLEHGTLGRYGTDIYRRFCWLTGAAPRLSVTFHTLLMPPAFDATGFAKALVRFKFKTAARMQADFHRTHLLSRGIARQLRRIQRYKPVSAIVHNRRDLNDARYLYGIQRVFDHPLSYLGAGEVEAIRSTAARRRFAMLDDLPPDAALIGVFGFLNEYKGIGTAIQALQYLPNNHHLLIFGGVHPQEIVPRQPRHPYISSLFDGAYMDTTLYDRLSGTGAGNAPPLVVAADQGLRELLGAHPRDLSARIHFMGALGESDFLSGMTICDAVVFPYLEVGQSSSGPISQALELGCRIIASRTHTFLEFAEYHKNAVEFFDIGNHLELAERLSACPQFKARSGLPDFNIETNKATYLLANSNMASSKMADTKINGPPLGLDRARSQVKARSRQAVAD
jgi:glycosyltransferase involved in cell wall biosynthesis